MSKMSRKTFLDSIANMHPRTHKTEQRFLEGKVSQDNIEYSVDDVSYVDDDSATRSVRIISHRTCDFGHLQDQKVKLLALCERCGKITCSTEGCGFTCVRCGRAFCRHHVSVYSDGQAYCSDCRWFKRLMVAFNLAKKVVK